jgi:hypothetical protein
LRAIEEAFGKVSETKNERSIYSIEIDTKAREFYAGYEGLSASKVLEYTHRASIFNALREGMHRQRAARASGTRKLKKKEFLATMLSWHREKSEELGVSGYGHVRSFERAFNRYLKEGYKSLLHGGLGNDQSRKVSVRTENLLLSLWRNTDKPFVEKVHKSYMEFIYGKQEFFDRESGEVYDPDEFAYEDKHGNRKPLEISISTAWNYLKDVVNETSIYMDRNGNFEYLNRKRPKHHRRLGRYSLSKISMDDAVLSRKSVRGWVSKYLAVDVVSGYWFRPSYSVGKVDTGNVYEAFRNMFCELEELGMPTPGELEVEYFLMQHLEWLKEVFPFVRFCESPTEKRSEHAIKSLKYGIAKEVGHTRGRWYAKHEAYRSVRNKMEGDYIEPLYQPQTIVADDLEDIDAHNNGLHPLQKTYPGMTRKDVFMSQINPDLRPLEKRILYKYIGNETETRIYNNDYCPVNNEEFELVNFDSLDRLKPNCVEVKAYWLPDKTGSVSEVYLYQEERYIGKAVNRGATSYNENQIEQTEEDEAKKLHQQKRIAKFDKKIKERRASIGKTGKMSTKERKSIEKIEVEIVETVQPEGYDETEMDYIALAVKQL